MISNYRKTRQPHKRRGKTLPWQQGRRRVLRRIILLPLFSLLLLFTIKGCYALRFERAITAMRDQGYPIGKAALQAQYPEVAPEENCVPSLLKAWECIEPIARLRWESLDSQYEWQRRYPDKRLHPACLLEYCRRPPWPLEWRTHFEAALARPGVYFADPERLHEDSHDLYFMLPESLFTEIRLRIEIEEYDQALALLEETLRLLEILHRAPPPFRADACGAWSFHLTTALMVLTTRVPVEKAALVRLNERLGRLDFWGEAQWMLDARLSLFDEELRCKGLLAEYERAKHTYEDWEERHQWHGKQRPRYPFTLTRWFRDSLYAASRLFSDDPYAMYRPPGPVHCALIRYFGGADCDLLHAYADYKATRPCLSLPPAAAHEKVYALLETQQQRLKSASWYSGQYMRPYYNLNTLWRAESWLACCRTGLAIEAYRRDHAEALPEKLEELAPAYLEALPKDPVSGKALYYQRHPEQGYVVICPGRYSLQPGDRFFDLDSEQIESRWPQFMVLR